jgi:hypothetical protein
MSTVGPIEPWTSASAWLGADATAGLVPRVAGASAMALSPLVGVVARAGPAIGLDTTGLLLLLSASCGGLLAGATYARARTLAAGVFPSAVAAGAIAAVAPVVTAATSPNSWIAALACWALALVALPASGRPAGARTGLAALAALWLLLAGDASWLPGVLIAGIVLVWVRRDAPSRRRGLALLAVAVLTGGIAFSWSAASQNAPAPGLPPSAWSTGRTALALLGGGLDHELAPRVLSAVGASARTLGAVGTALVACSAAWGARRQYARRVLAAALLGAVTAAAAWRALAPEALGTVLAVTLAPLLATGLRGLDALRAGRGWRVALATWVVGAPVLAASLAGPPPAWLRRDVEATADAVAGASALASDDWRRASALLNAVHRRTGRAPFYALPTPAALRALSGRGPVLLVGGQARRRELARHGFDFSMVPVWSAPLAEALASWPGDRFVLFGLSREAGLVELEPGGRPMILSAIGGQSPVPAAGAGMAALGWTGTRPAARERRSQEDLTLWVDEGQRLGESRPVPVNAAVRIAGAEVLLDVNGEVAAASTSGAALALLDPLGRVEREEAWWPGEPLRMPVSAREVGALARVVPLPCAEPAGGRVAHLALDRPTRAVAVIAGQSPAVTVMVASATTAPAVIALGPADDPLDIRPEIIDAASDPGRERLAGLAQALGAPAHALTGAGRFLARLETQVSPGRAVEFVLGLDTTVVTAAWEARGAGGRVCVVGGDGSRAFEGRSRRFDVPMGDVRVFDAAAWHPLERDAGRWFRWTAAAPAHLVVPLARVGDVRVSVDASPASGARGDDAVQLAVNGTPVDAGGGRRGPSTRWWVVPGARWHPGWNTLSLGTPELVVPASRDGGHDTRALGLAVRRVSLELVGRAESATAPR